MKKSEKPFLVWPRHPGPDGFHPIFFKSKWEVVGQDVFNFVASVFENPSLIGNVNHTLLTLIPKLDDPKKAADFRLIALCNVIYKVVTKVLTNRIRLVLPHIIAGSQSSFIQGRDTKDNSIVLQEAVHTMQGMTSRKRFMIIKLDLAKAYDKLEWRFVLESLEILNFPKNIVELNKACLVSSSMAITWQGCASDPFFPTRGLHQGDPLSPLLFVIALERLNHCIMDAVNQGLWKPLKFGRGGPLVSHLMFADDILLISEATPDNTTTIMDMDILDKFGARSGQQVNKQKSRVFFSNNTPQHMQQAISNQLGIALTSDLGHYLGMPILSGKKGRHDYSFIVTKVQRKLSGWKAKTLSQAGRVQLAQSCIMSLPSYVMHTALIPASICEEIECLCRDFIWGSSSEVRCCHLISWETICSPKEEGGLGFRSLHLVNALYMMKLGWELMTNKEALWAQVLRFKYHCGNLLIPVMRCGAQASHIWRGITKYWPQVESGISWVIQKGQHVQFWQDFWVPGLGALCDHVSDTIPPND